MVYWPTFNAINNLLNNVIIGTTSAKNISTKHVNTKDVGTKNVGTKAIYVRDTCIISIYFGVACTRHTCTKSAYTKSFYAMDTYIKSVYLEGTDTCIKFVGIRNTCIRCIYAKNACIKGAFIGTAYNSSTCIEVTCTKSASIVKYLGIHLQSF